ncbi:Brp/Blh family beta-carotene 15,15'-dioxygenase [Flavobacteriaceae bacterium]|nr:Brp/Blh family beta-carotene 15,15'-dioxygenase [Flavobacteriaceae bacterium]
MNINNILITTTFFCLWLTSQIPESVQYSIAFFFIFTLGILHGSNDLSIVSKIKKVATLKKLGLFLSGYILVVVIAALVFYVAPKVALLFFILFSGYHFGEQHFHNIVKKNSIYRGFLFISYGLVVLFLILALNISEVSLIIQDIIGYTFDISVYYYCLLACFIVFALLGVKYYLDQIIDFKTIVYELFLLLVFFIVFSSSNLIWSFAIYFILWHSIPSIVEQLDYLYKEISWKSFLKYIKKSFVVWLISIMGIGSLLYFFKDDKQIFLPIIFSFLGAITFAHSFVISKMFKKNPPTFKK